MKESSYNILKLYIEKFPRGVTWFRLKKHCEIVDKHLNPGEKIDYMFAGQLDNNHLSFFNTGVVAVTNQRLLIAQNRLIVGYECSSVTPDLYNDMQVDAGLLWGLICIDTVKEKVYVSNLDKRALPEIETTISTFMHDARKLYKKDESK